MRGTRGDIISVFFNPTTQIVVAGVARDSRRAQWKVHLYCGCAWEYELFSKCRRGEFEAGVG